MIQFFMYDNALFDILDRIMEAYDTGKFEGQLAPNKDELRGMYDNLVDYLREERGCKYVKSFDTIQEDKLQPYIREYGAEAVVCVVQEKFTLPEKC